SGYTLIELIFAIALIGILAAIAIVGYRKQVRHAQLITIYQEVNRFRLPYQIIIDEGVGVTGFSPDGMNMPDKTSYCEFSVTPPNIYNKTPNAVLCQIQNIGYLQNQYLSLDRAVDGTWQCRASIGISKSYLPQACQ